MVSEKHLLLALVHQNSPFVLSQKGYCPKVSLLLSMLLHTHFFKASENGIQQDSKATPNPWQLKWVFTAFFQNKTIEVLKQCKLHHREYPFSSEFFILCY